MKIRAEKREVVFADVTYNGWDYKVYPDGVVMVWEVDDDNQNGHYTWMSECEDGYNEIKAAGLNVLKLNERIEELYSEALDKAVPETWTTLDADQLSRLKDKFAELIVRECASKVTRNEALNIFEHFGVEE